MKPRILPKTIIGASLTILALGVISCQTVQTPPPPTPVPTLPVYMFNNPTLTPLENNWELVWSDEFDGGEIVTTNWGYEEGYVRNQEQQYYTTDPENASVVDGKLVIRARREEFEGYEYTSASVHTLGKQEFQYGRFEIRARIPTGSGSWPAWWAMGTNITSEGWPRCGEVDMMEFYRGVLLFNTMNSLREWSSVTVPFGDSERFHHYTMDWDEVSIRLYFDGVLMNEYDLERAQIGKYNPFKQKMYMILNLAIGGTNGGDPSQSEFPMIYEIDYVRVYQKQ